MSFLFALPFDKSLRSLNRTLYVLNLIRLKDKNQGGLQQRKNDYLINRLRAPSPKGQIGYHKEKSEDYQKIWKTHSAIFEVLTGLAIISVLTKLYLKSQGIDSLSWLLSSAAILFPVLAVAVLSWAHIKDSEGRHQSHEKAKLMAMVMAERIENAQTEKEFIQLVDITEKRLLQETLEWESRTKNRGVA